MYYRERLDKIIEILEKRTKASVHALAKELFVSEPTIRRDLCVLESEGKIKRTYGGAVLSEVLNVEVPFDSRFRANTAEKDFIARLAAQRIKDGNVLFLDASSTVQAIVKYLSAFHNLTVVTNSPKTSLMLAERQIKSFCTGGLLLENSIAYVGPLAERFISNFNADIFFFSCRGLAEDGTLTDSSIEESEIRKVMMARAKKKVFLCDSSKFNKEYMYRLSHVNDVDEIISNAKLPKFD